MVPIVDISCGGSIISFVPFFGRLVGWQSCFIGLAGRFTWLLVFSNIGTGRATGCLTAMAHAPQYSAKGAQNADKEES